MMYYFILHLETEYKKLTLFYMLYTKQLVHVDAAFILLSLD